MAHSSTADTDLKLQKFTGIFSCEVNSSDCRALSAPGLSDIYPQLQRGSKRPNFATRDVHSAPT